MPELPEVEVTRRGIAPTLTGNRVVAVIARTPALRYPLPDNLEQKLGNQRLTAVRRRGKYLLLDFGHGQLLIHLGMSGSLRLVPASLPAEKHDHFDLAFAIKAAKKLHCACAIRDDSARFSGSGGMHRYIRCWRCSASNR
jgi:formamidopyrimidine-DNA glycosylase